MAKRAIGFLFILLVCTITGCATHTVDSTKIAKLGSSESSISATTDNQKNLKYRVPESLFPTDASKSGETPPTSAPSTQQQQAQSYEAHKDAVFLELLQKQLDGCKAASQEFEDDARHAGKWEISIATVGVVAGSIIAPAVSAKAAAAAWAGVSGAANAAQLTLNAKGRSYEVLMATQKSLNNSIKEKVKDIENIKTPQAASAFIYELYSICQFPSIERPAAEKSGT